APPAAEFGCAAQVRYRQHEEPCRVRVRDDGTLSVRFERPQRAATPGQALVLYDGQACLGGAVSASTDAPAPAQRGGAAGAKTGMEKPHSDRGPGPAALGRAPRQGP